MYDTRYSGAYASCINELTFRHIFQHIDGQTAEPKSFSGSIEQQLTCYEKLSVVDYEPIDCSIPDIDRNLLRKDQQYLLDISNAPWDMSRRLGKSDLGPLFHSRWLLAANRVLRLYISSSDPYGNLKEIVGFILKSYVPVWFALKKSKYFTDGPKTCLSSNPNITFQASSYIEVLNWNSCVVYPPPMLPDLSEDDIKSLMNSDTTPIREVKKFPCHTQAVERCIKLVAKASNKVCEREAKDGHIRATLRSRATSSRSVMSNFSKKSDFKCVVDIKKKK
ncbi:hypothetical protein AVEN_159413-1 [Araneus ventricosus]|uniref:Uncharacterized protein n=1 Tax=Araneus ventricosus TaxID=182803 RepID=A0A4Y2A0T2_ARAVE|nr:hypothetical protein AVEN_159413-1 [Araneus ventricosus]